MATTNKYCVYKVKNIYENVRVPSSCLNNYEKYILDILKKNEKKCNQNGYIHEILKIINISDGIIYESDFSSDLIFKVQYEAIISEPKKNEMIECKIFQISNSDIIAKQGPLLIIVLIDKKDRKNLSNGDHILVKILATRFIYCMPLIKAVASFEQKIKTKDNLDSQFVDDFDFIEQEQEQE